MQRTKTVYTRNRYRSKVCIVIADKGEMSKKNYRYACQMFVVENTACLFTFVKMSLFNSEENICSVISVLFKKSVTY